MTPGEQLSASWFQSVTFRTAGFNTVDMGALQPGTKFFGIMLMFVGASPGSTGGGIKTVAFALSILAVITLLKGREQIELRGRAIPESIVKRALMIVALGIVCVLTTTLLIVVIEDRPELFLDHLFEATCRLRHRRGFFHQYGRTGNTFAIGDYTHHVRRQSRPTDVSRWPGGTGWRRPLFLS